MILAEGPGYDFIHSECFDADGDGDLDWIGARYQPGWIVWLEQPAKPLDERWILRVVDDQVNGVHGLLRETSTATGEWICRQQCPAPAAVSQFGGLAADSQNSAGRRTLGPVSLRRQGRTGTESLFRRGRRQRGRPPRYLAGRQGGPQAEPGTGEWFAWWEAPADPTQTWKKHLIAEHSRGRPIFSRRTSTETARRTSSRREVMAAA